MKTKISRFGRSSVSVILVVMMLLSTMLIGTVSTVNAATTPLEGALFQQSMLLQHLLKEALLFMSK